MKGDAMLWAGILTSPIVWLLNLEVSFALVPLACSGRGKISLYFVSGISLLLTALAGVISGAQLHGVAEKSALVEARSTSRKRAMAYGGIALSILFFLVILAQAVPNVMMAACE